MPFTKQKRFPQYASNKQACLTETEGHYVCKQLELGREINTVKMQHGNLHSMNSINENIWFYSETYSEEINPYKEMMMNRFERHNINQTKPEMDSWSTFSNIVKYTQYEQELTNIDIKVSVDKQSMKIFAKPEINETMVNMQRR